MLHSNYKPLCHVDLPLPTLGRQFYMHSFNLSNPSVPLGFEDYLLPVTKLLLHAQAFSGEAHLTIDEKIVKAGMSQRRPKPHVDGCFIKQGPRGIWSHEPPSGPYWAHGCNNLHLTEVSRMPVIVAASAVGCKVWKGIFDGVPKSDGDLSHISDQLGVGEVVPVNCGFLLSADCVHESMILDVDTPRTFIRIALPNSFNGV